MKSRKEIGLYKANRTVATRLLHRAFWMRTIKRLKQGKKRLEASPSPCEDLNLSIGTFLCLRSVSSKVTSGLRRFCLGHFMGLTAKLTAKGHMAIARHH